MKTISFVPFYVVLSALNTQGAVTNSSYPLLTQSVKNYISADGLAAWVKAWLGVLSREVNTARMKDENLTAEVQDLHRSDDNFWKALRDMQQKLNNEQREVDRLKNTLKGCTGHGRTAKYQNKEYYFGDPFFGGTQEMAQTCCHLMGKNLLAVDSPAEFMFIKDYLPRGRYIGYWLDAECINKRCIWKNSPGSSFYNPGIVGVNNGDGGEKCLGVTYAYGAGYVYQSCTTPRYSLGFACE